jgi:thiol-disulfide isomerase/thioredoxin
MLAGAGAVAAALAGCSGGDGGSDGAAGSGNGGSGTPTGPGGGSGGSAGGWRGTELTDVLTGDSFTVAGLAGPVVLESFAVWCPVCTSQQEVLGAVAGDGVSVVSLNTDPNEDAEAVRSHAEEHGFDWRYAVAPSAMTQALIEEFGPGITSAPSAPVVVLCEDGSATYLDEHGVKSAETIRSAVEGC